MLRAGAALAAGFVAVLGCWDWGTPCCSLPWCSGAVDRDRVGGWGASYASPEGGKGRPMTWSVLFLVVVESQRKKVPREAPKTSLIRQGKPLRTRMDESLQGVFGSDFLWPFLEKDVCSVSISHCIYLGSMTRLLLRLFRWVLLLRSAPLCIKRRKFLLVYWGRKILALCCIACSLLNLIHFCDLQVSTWLENVDLSQTSLRRKSDFAEKSRFFS